MRTMKQRLIAVLCCVVLLVTSLYISEPQEAEAAETAGTLTITSASAKFTLGSTAGYLNLGYTTDVADYGNYGNDFLTAAFIEEYITFGGGMTSTDLMNGKLQFVIATNNILQFNWNQRSTAFTEGWSFTIAQGAPISYRTTAGALAYLALEKDYTFTLQSGDGTCDNIVNITGCYVEEFSLGNLALWGNGVADSPYTQLYFADSPNSLTRTPQSGDVKTELQSNPIYADFISITNKNFEDLNGDVIIRSRMDTNHQIIEIKAWGSLRTTMTSGDRLIFHKGLPVYYTDTTGAACRAELDATYVYQCVGSNSSNSQTFLGVKLDDTTKYGLNTNATGENTVAQSGSLGNEQYVNLWFDASISSLSSHAVSKNIMAETMAEDYIQVADLTMEQVETLGMAIRFIPNAGNGCLQVALSEKMVDALKVGSKIMLKEGMPIVYEQGGTLYAATLDADYEIIVKSNDGTVLNVSYTLVDTYSLKGSINKSGAQEGGYWYYDIGIESNAFDDATSGTQGSFGELWKDYLTLSEHDVADFTDEGAHMNWYLIDGYRIVRPYTNLTFADGEVLMIKEGLPFTYTNTEGKAKTVYLDKDYGFVYSTATGTFTYDPTLESEPEPEVPEVDTLAFKNATEPMFLEDLYKVNFYYNTEATLTADVEQTLISSNAETMEYIDIAGLDAASLTSLGVEVKFIPIAECFQIKLGTTLDWLTVGDEITFKEGMPVYYVSGGETKTVYLEKTATFTVANFDTIGSQVGELVRYGEPAEFAFDKAKIGSRKGADGSQTMINILDPTTEELTVLDDMKDNQYVTLSAEIVNSYIDFCGLTAEEVASAGVKFVLIHASGYEVLQIQWGTSVNKMELGDRLIFKEGLPITYETTDGYQKTITLCQDYIYEAGTGGVDDNYFFNYTEVKLGGTWALISGKEYTTGNDGEGTPLYSLIEFASCDLMSEVSSLYLTIEDDVMNEYVSFGDIEPSTYSTRAILAKAIINADNQVIQLFWGDATEDMSIGNEIVFKEGMPILATATDGTQRLYTLDGDYSFVLDSHEESKNGFIITGVRKVQTTVQGDLDEDYLLNKNDITLLRKQLIQLIELDDDRIADATENDVVDSKDLVRAKKEWNTEEPEDYTTIYKYNGISDMVAAGQTVTYAINADIDTKNYVRLTFKTTQNLYGTFNYTGDDGQSYTENFYLAKEDVQFEQFFDNYRDNGMNVVGKTLVSITLKNVGTEAADVHLNEVEISDRAFENTDFLWAENGSLKVGIDLNMGGSLGYLESLKYNPVEVKENNEIRIETGVSATDTYSNVNLINIYDLGRQIQQAFYIDVQDSNYAAGTYNDTTWPYNPVQAGDTLGNNSQIIDYRCVDTDGKNGTDMIYIKVRAMDWAIDNSTTESYMENWYRLSGNLLYTDNAFVDWAGWQSIGEAKSQELPAFYAGQSLNYFVEGKDPSTRTVYGSWSTEGERFYADATTGLSNWYAWVNEDADDAFGLGIYIPGATACVAGRIKETRKYNWLNDFTGVNRNGDEAPILSYEHIKALYKHEYQNCFLHNTSYIAPSAVMKLEEYRTYEYTYVLTAENLDQMAIAFDTVEVENPEMNSSMTTWD